MAHATNRLARIYDEINRDGLEWLMDPVKNYQRYQDIYANKSPRTRFIRRFAISLLCLPLFSLAYVFTRTTGVILNPREWRDNPLKPFMMSCLAGGAIGVPMLAMGVKSFMALATLGIPGVGGLILAVGLLSTMTAGIMYLAKMMVRSIDDTIDNTGGLIQAKGLSGKHRLSFGNSVEKFAPAYRALLEQHKATKESQPPIHISIIKRGKELLAAFEEALKRTRPEP